MTNCFICNSPKALDNTICEPCIANPDAYDLYVMKFRDLLEPILQGKTTPSKPLKIPYWEIPSEYEKVKDAPEKPKPIVKKVEKKKPEPLSISQWF